MPSWFLVLESKFRTQEGCAKGDGRTCCVREGRMRERQGGRISGDEAPSRAQDFREFNIVLGASADSTEGCNGVLNLRGSQPTIFLASRSRLTVHC